MKEYNFFNSKVLVFENTDVRPYDKTSNFYKKLDYELNHSEIFPIEVHGGLYQFYEKGLIEIEDFDRFFDKLYDSVEAARKQFNFSKNVISFRRLWVNRIFTNVKSFTHNHYNYGSDPCDLIGIYYYHSEGDSAKLVFTDLNEFGIFDDQINPSNKKELVVNTGDFVFHDPNIFHAVSRHLSDIPRICFIFELNFLSDEDIKTTDITI